MTRKPTFQWDDPFLFDTQLDEDERMVRDTARDYAQEKLMPRVLMANRNETFDPEIYPEMGELGLLGLLGALGVCGVFPLGLPPEEVPS